MAASETIAPLPTIEEELHVGELLREAHDGVEALVWRVGAITNFGGGIDLPPVPITLEDIGVVACLTEDLDIRLRELEHYRDKLRGSLFSLHALRLEQVARSVGES
jgi:hypothetical protein